MKGGGSGVTVTTVRSYRGLCTPQKLSKAVAMAGTRTWESGYAQQIHIIYTYIHTCIRPVSVVIYPGCNAAAAAVLARCVCWALQWRCVYRCCICYSCFLEQPKWADKSLSVPPLGAPLHREAGFEIRFVFIYLFIYLAFVMNIVVPAKLYRIALTLIKWQLYR